MTNITTNSNTNSNTNNNHHKQNNLLIILLTAIALGLVYWAYTQLEWEEKEIDLGYSKEARQNPFLAAEVFLRKHGIEATSVKNLSLLDKHRWRNIELGQQDTLVLINANKTLDEERYNSLYEWVENGGTLITSTQNPFMGTHTAEEDLLLSDFGITPAEQEAKENQDFFANLADELDGNDNKGKKKEKENTESSTAGNNEEIKSEHSKKDEAKTGEPEKPENYYRCSLDEQPTEIEFADETKPLRIDFSREAPFTHRWVEGHAGEEEYSDDEGDSEREEKTHLAYFDIGEGAITVTSDNYIWSNRRIDCHDHAYALWSLVNPNGRVWFLINQDAPSLASIIWQQAKYAVLAALLALACWLWAKGARFGPVFVAEQQGRRSLAEHIYASAMLLWRKQQHPQLLKLLREEILDRLEQQQPQLSKDESKSVRIQLIQQLTGLKDSEIQQALYADDLFQPQAFATAIAHLQIIRKQL